MTENDTSKTMEIPETQKRIIKSLKRQQHEITKLRFDMELKKLQVEREFTQRFNEVFARRAKIVNGKEVLSEKDGDWDSEPEDVVQMLPESLFNSGDSANIPEFWLHALKNSEFVEVMGEQDEEAIKALTDIRCVDFADDSGKVGFEFEFHFTENPFFENDILRKKYYYPECVEDKTTDFNLQTEYCTTDEIRWKPGKNILANAGNKDAENADGFFTFFKAHDSRKFGPDTDGEAISEYELDQTLAIELKEEVIPKAVLMYTGEIFYDDDDDEDEDDEDMSESGDDE